MKPPRADCEEFVKQPAFFFAGRVPKKNAEALDAGRSRPKSDRR